MIRLVNLESIVFVILNKISVRSNFYFVDMSSLNFFITQSLSLKQGSAQKKIWSEPGTHIFEIRVGSTRNPGTHGLLGSGHADPW